MFRSPPLLRSGSKGEPVRLDQDKKAQSLSASEPIDVTTMAPVDKSNSVVDQAAVIAAVNNHLAGDDVISRLASRLSTELKSVVEDAVKSAMTCFTAELDKLRGEVAGLTEKLRELDDRFVYKTDELEQYQRRNNLRVFGVPETPGENTDSIVVGLCRDQLGVELLPTSICRSHRVGAKPQPQPDGRQRHRSIIVRFTSYHVRRQVFAAKRKLKGTGVTVCEDLTPRRMEVLRKASATFGVRKTWTQDGRILWLSEDGRRGMATRLSELSS